MIHKIAYASCYVYSPAGAGAVCERSRLLCALLKAGDAQFLVKYALRVHQQAEESSRLSGFFRSTDILVPVPGSAPKSAAGTWVAAALAMLSCAKAWASWRGVACIVFAQCASPQPQLRARAQPSPYTTNPS